MLANELSLPSLSDLLSTMAKGVSTNGWDIVTSYGVDALNKVLAASHEGGKLVKDLTIETKREDPITGLKFTIVYELTLGAPTLQFVAGQSGSATLTMPISKGSYTFTPEGLPVRKGDLPSGYSVVASVPLAALTGDGKISTSGDVITFDEGTGDEARIVLHFKSTKGSGASFTVQPFPDQNNYDLLNTYLLPGLETYFQESVDETDYALTIVAVSQKSDDIVIQPKSFVFASDTGVLSLYIQTTNSGNPQGNIHPSFQPGAVEILPIPEGYSASLILSRDFVKKVYLGPTLQKLGTVVYDDTAEGGISLRLYRSTPPLRYDASHTGATALAIDPIVVDFSQLPYGIRFFNNTATVTWSYSQTLSWRTDTVDLETGDDIVETGQTRLAVALPSAPPITIQLTGVAGNDITVDLDIQGSQYSISTEGRTGWLSSGPSVAADLTSYIQSHLPGAISFNFGGLNYFTAANLLFPSSQTFQVDSSVGINVPLDLILVGQING